MKMEGNIVFLKCVSGYNLIRDSRDQLNEARLSRSKSKNLNKSKEKIFSHSKLIEMSTSLLFVYLSIVLSNFLIAQAASPGTFLSSKLQKATTDGQMKLSLKDRVSKSNETLLESLSSGERSSSARPTIPFAYKQKEMEQEGQGNGKVVVGGEQVERQEKLVEHLLATFPSKRNQRLIEMLKARRSHFQVFYPAKDSEEKEELEGKEEREQVSESTRMVGNALPNAAELNRQTKVSGNNRIRFQRAPIEFFPSSKTPQSNSRANQVLGNYRTNVVIKAFNYKLRLDLELNNNLFGPSLIQKHFLPNGAQQISTQKIEQCYYHARTQPEAKPAAIGAFRTCNGLSGIIHVNNESFVIHPFYDSDLSKKHPHIIYRYQSDTQVDLTQQTNGEQQQANYRQCGANRLHEWALRQFNKLTPQAIAANWNSINRFERQTNNNNQNILNDSKGTLDCMSNNNNNNSNSVSNLRNNKTTCDNKIINQNKGQQLKQRFMINKHDDLKMRFSKRDVSLTEKYIELALILSKDMFDKRNSSTRLEAIHDAIQIVNILDLYFRSANTRVALIYLETWAHGDQIEITNDVKQTLYNFLEYSTRKLYKVSMDAIHLLTGGHLKMFDFNEMGMSIPDSICSSRAASVSQEASVFEPFIAASTMAHMLGHNLGMEHDDSGSTNSGLTNSPNHRALASLADIVRGNNQLESTTTIPQPLVIDSLKNNQASIVQHRHRQQQQQHNNSNNQDSISGDEHEDEIKSRSISDSITLERTSRGALFGDNYLSGSDEYCRSNCLMSERFTYLQPPVSIGNMIQQQVATGSVNINQSLSSPFSSIVTMYNSPDSTVNLHQQEQQLQQSNQQSVQPLNGPTMNQIDNELQHDHLVSTSLPFKFSKQSIETYHKLLRMGHGICLFNKPNQLEDFKTCGNGIVDKGEDCDCGTFQECLENDSCCDPITCRFKADAECINGACCDRCKLRQKGFVCRKSRSECDLAEYCDGKSSQCAPDVYKQNGHPCSNNLGYCYLGHCPIHDVQCAQLWGSDSKRADKLCYTTFNLNGTIRGNCGFDSTLRKYKRCDYDDAMCGTLQCQLGDMKPITASLDIIPIAQLEQSNNNNSISNGLNHTHQSSSIPEFSKKTLHTHDGFHHECKVITGPNNNNFNSNSNGINHSNGNQFMINPISYVRDGSKCGTNKVCFNQTCQKLEQVYRDSFELCPKDEQGNFCSGNGICSTANKCQCDQDWIGHDCSQRIIIQQQTTLPHFINLTENLSRSSLSITNSTSPNSISVLHFNHSLPTISPVQQPTDSSQRAVPAVVIIPNTSIGDQQKREQQQQQQQPAVVVLSDLITASTPIMTQTTFENSATPLPPPPPVVSPSNVTGDKKKNHGLEAPGLVVILVSIVAFVYLGFALMANCYRREGFIKPDKVLRHHQMNCKLDAMRSSFIAKRLADAGIASGVGASNAGNIGFGLEQNQANNDSNSDPPSLQGIVDNSAGNNNKPNMENEHVTVDLMNSFSIGQPVANQTNCKHLAPSILFDTTESGKTIQLNQYGTEDGIIKSHYRSQTFSANPQQSRSNNANSIAATVHYFDDPQRTNNSNSNCIHQQPRTSTIDTFGFETGSGDHIPLLAHSAADTHKTLSRLQTRKTNRLVLRSFNAPKVTDNHQNIYQSHWAAASQRENVPQNNGIGQSILHRNHHHHNHSSIQQQLQHQYQQQQMQSSTFVGRGNRTMSQQINRAISLGEVCGQQARQDRLSSCQDYDGEVHRSMTAHRALTTPVRSSRPSSFKRVINIEDESCSAPSSPDHRDPCWSDAESQQHLQRQQAASVIQGYSLSRQHSRSRLSASRQPTAQTYHEDAIIAALSTPSAMMANQQQLSRRSFGDQANSGREMHQIDPSFEQTVGNAAKVDNLGNDDDDDNEDSNSLPNLPPPPPPPPLMADDEGGVDADIDGDDENATEDDTDPLPVSSSQATKRGVKRQSEPMIRSPIINSMRTIRRIPLNNGENDTKERLSLIAQLQQLERVQSMHQSQMANDKKLSTSEGLHEFFSLPLSVQLSALLARSLCDVDPREINMAPLDEYLNTLNNSSVAASSRRSFKRQSSHQTPGDEHQQQTGSWGHRQQQVKLHNLQGLINRLQKLHSQTVLEQQLDELNGEFVDVTTQRGSRQSTLSRNLGRLSRSISRANQTADDLYARDHGSGWSRGGSRNNSTKLTRRAETSSGGTNKNESVYSMSDSEDGAYVSSVYLSYQQKMEAIKNKSQKEKAPVEKSERVVFDDQNLLTSSFVHSNNDQTLGEKQEQHEEQRHLQNQSDPSNLNGVESLMNTTNQPAVTSDTTDRVEGSTKTLQTDV